MPTASAVPANTHRAPGARDRLLERLLDAAPAASSSRNRDTISSE